MPMKKCAFIISVPFLEQAKNKPPSSEILEKAKIMIGNSDREVSIGFAGFLNRYNYESTGSTPITAAQQALEDEINYFSFFEKIFPTEQKFIFWKKEINKSEFEKLRTFVDYLFVNNEEFANIVRKIVKNFLKKFFFESVILDLMNWRSIKKNIKNYVLEECAFTLSLRKEGFEELIHIGEAKGAISWIAKQHFDKDFEVLSGETFNKINDHKLELNYIVLNTPKKQHLKSTTNAGTNSFSSVSDAQAGVVPQKKKSSLEKACKGFFNNPYISQKEKAEFLSRFFKEFSNINTTKLQNKLKEGCADAPEAYIENSSFDSKNLIFRPRADSI